MTDPTPQPKLDRLIHRLSVLIGTATYELERDMPPHRALLIDPAPRVKAWYDEVAAQLRRYSPAAYLSGAGVDELSTAARRAVARDIATQLKFLEQFKVEIQAAPEWQAGWNARAAMYARSIVVPYWRGATRLLPLPAMPGDGSTQCLTNCKCSWRVDELNGDGNYDAYWIYGDTDRHCQGCQQREIEWSPLQIRDGVLL